ncbi:hypothetical protein HELRODRAFT_189095 [Helobdella robusta]|uniref:Uncharacterized protein n=1 Tax=Helobdella robusta TaxID=6412 RepID=T1FQM7_HELRO|nr:hypothetical protein HELRODRAFT_189095 [Helobdella robusta]ESN96062.1 hypothetical protein HELRODRAFT_189095 [Helobdella robusta]
MSGLITSIKVLHDGKCRLDWSHPIGYKQQGVVLEKRRGNSEEWTSVGQKVHYGKLYIDDGGNDDDDDDDDDEVVVEYRARLNDSGDDDNDDVVGDDSDQKLFSSKPPHSEGSEPRFLTPLSNTDIMIGGEAVMVAKVAGSPWPTAKWFLNNSPVIVAGRISKTENTQTGIFDLVIKDTKSSDAGLITCELSNFFGKVTSSAKLNVLVRPSFSQSTYELSLLVGQSTKQRIAFSGSAPHRFNLSIDDLEIVKRSGSEVNDDGDDDRNEDDDDDDDVPIEVLSNEDDDFVTLYIKRASMKMNGRQYSLQLSNSVASANCLINIIVKGPPGKCLGPLRVDDVNKNSCTLSWRPPQMDGFSKILHYVVEKNDVEKSYWTTACSNVKTKDIKKIPLQTTQASIDNLIEDKVYRFRVSAVNIYATPASPGQPIISNVSKTRATLTWTASPLVDQQQSLCSCTVENLIEGRVYKFRVVPSNEAGSGTPSKSSPAVKIEDQLEIPTFKVALQSSYEVLAERYKGSQNLLPTATSAATKTTTSSSSFSSSSSSSNSNSTNVPKYEITIDDGEADFESVHTLTIKNLSADDADEYMVRAQNLQGNKTSRTILVVNGWELGIEICSFGAPPRIHVPQAYEQPLIQDRGSLASIKFYYSATPLPSIQWLNKRTGEKLYAAERPTIDDVDDDVTDIDDAFYSNDPYCSNSLTSSSSTLFNRQSSYDYRSRRRSSSSRISLSRLSSVPVGSNGVTSGSANFNTETVPRSFSERVRFDSTSRFVMMRLENLQSKDAGEYDVVLTNKYGEDQATVKIKINDVPGVPRNLTFEEVTDGCLILKWDEPEEDGGSTITQYFVEILHQASGNSYVDNSKWLPYSLTRITKCKVENVLHNKIYQLRVGACNVFGRGQTSEPIRIVPGQSDDVIKVKKISQLGHIFEIEETLASSEQAKLDLITDKQTSRSYLCETIKLNDNTTSVNPDQIRINRKSVMEEAELMSKMSGSKKLQKLCAVYEDEDAISLVLEFLSGEDILSRLANENERTTEEDVARLIRQLCEGVQHLHENNAVHLNIKPENLIFTTSKSQDIKLTNFSKSALLDPTKHIPVLKVNECRDLDLNFMAPELLSDGGNVGFYSDMWAVGVITYVLLTGKFPFEAKTREEKVAKILSCKYSMDHKKLNVSESAKDFVANLIDKEPSMRMTSQEALDHPWLCRECKYSTKLMEKERYVQLLESIEEEVGKKDCRNKNTEKLSIGKLVDATSLLKNTKNIVLHKVDRKEVQPRFVWKPRNQSAIEGTVASFKCKIISPEKLTVTWFKDSNPIPTTTTTSSSSSTTKYVTTNTGSYYELKINKVTSSSDRGEYVVRAENVYGRVEEAALLSIEAGKMTSSPSSSSSSYSKKSPVLRSHSLEPSSSSSSSSSSSTATKSEVGREPEFTFALRDRSIQEGTAFKLSSCVEGQPSPKITWYKDGVEIDKSNIDYDISYAHGMCSLEVENCLRKIHGGKFTCRASNTMGATETSCTVHIYGDSENSSTPSSLTQMNKSRRRFSYSGSGSHSSISSFSRGEIPSYTSRGIGEISSYTSRVTPVTSSYLSTNSVVGSSGSKYIPTYARRLSRSSIERL